MKFFFKIKGSSLNFVQEIRAKRPLKKFLVEDVCYEGTLR